MQWFKVPPKIYFENDSIQYLEKMEDISRAFIVTDPTMVKLGYVDKILYYLRKREQYCHSEIYSDVEPGPDVETIMRGVEAMRAFQPDVIIALGGGSAIDAAKGMWLFYEHPETTFDGLKLRFMDIRKRAFKFPKLGAKAKMVAIPTTSGTGSEVTSFAVLTDRAKGVKYPLVDDALLPDEAILDPSLLAGVPPAVTADTGMDVLTHAAEAYVARGATPYTDALAEKAFTLAWQNLRPAWETAGESGAKGNMLLASNLAGIAFNAAGLGICHSLAHALGGRFHLPHGRLNALILPHVIHFNAADGTAAEKYGRLARLCGLAANPRSLAAGLNRLRAQLKLPERLSACGVEGKELTAALDGLAEAAQADLCAPSNPRPAAAEDLKSLLRELA